MVWLNSSFNIGTDSAIILHVHMVYAHFVVLNLNVYLTILFFYYCLLRTRQFPLILFIYLLISEKAANTNLLN